MDASVRTTRPDEDTWRYEGWRVVVICFLIAAFVWSIGFYGQSVFVAELQRLRGWPASLIAGATTFFYIASACLVVFVGDLMRRFGPRLPLAFAVCCLALAGALLGQVSTTWQLFAVYALMAVGWAGVTVAALSTTIAFWFDRRRGFALSLALNGASIGGVIGVPALVAAIDAIGFPATMAAAGAGITAVLLPLILFGLGTPPVSILPGAVPARGGGEVRAHALRSLRFWTITMPFSMVLLAQVGFIVHQIAYLEPLLGRNLASLAMSLMTVMAVAGRVAVGFIVDRVDQRLISSMLFVGQALSIIAMLVFPSPAVLFIGSAVFGVAVGNAITLPSILVHREFASGDFGVVVSLVMAITSFVSACGPLLAGALHDVGGSFALPFGVSAALEIAAAAGVLIRGRRAASF